MAPDALAVRLKFAHVRSEIWSQTVNPLRLHKLKQAKTDAEARAQRFLSSGFVLLFLNKHEEIIVYISKYTFKLLLFSFKVYILIVIV